MSECESEEKYCEESKIGILHTIHSDKRKALVKHFSDLHFNMNDLYLEYRHYKLDWRETVFHHTMFCSAQADLSSRTQIKSSVVT